MKLDRTIAPSSSLQNNCAIHLSVNSYPEPLPLFVANKLVDPAGLSPNKLDVLEELIWQASDHLPDEKPETTLHAMEAVIANANMIAAPEEIQKLYQFGNLHAEGQLDGDLYAYPFLVHYFRDYNLRVNRYREYLGDIVHLIPVPSHLHLHEHYLNHMFPSNVKNIVDMDATSGFLPKDECSVEPKAVFPFPLDLQDNQLGFSDDKDRPTVANITCFPYVVASIPYQEKYAIQAFVRAKKDSIKSITINSILQTEIAFAVNSNCFPAWELEADNLREMFAAQKIIVSGLGLASPLHCPGIGNHLVYLKRAPQG